MQLKNWIFNKKLAILTALIGGVAGWFYWYYIGCDSGTCAITSVWYRTAAYGALIGWFVGDYANDKFKQTQNKTDEN
jgi:hypothetical protein